MRKYLVILLLAVVGLSIQAQTNSPVAPPVHEVIQVDSAWTSLSAMLHFLGLTETQVGLLLLAIHTACRYIRNYWLANKTTAAGKIASLIGHIALHPLPAGPVAPETKPNTSTTTT